MPPTLLSPLSNQQNSGHLLPHLILALQHTRRRRQGASTFGLLTSTFNNAGKPPPSASSPPPSTTPASLHLRPPHLHLRRPSTTPATSTFDLRQTTPATSTFGLRQTTPATLLISTFILQTGKELNDAGDPLHTADRRPPSYCRHDELQFLFLLLKQVFSDADEHVIFAKSHLEKDGPTEFPSLKEPVMEDLPMMESIYKMSEERLTQAAAFPWLESLCASGCPKLTRLPFELDKLEGVKCEKEWWEKLHGEEIRSSLTRCVVYVPVAAPLPPPPSLLPVPPRSLVLLRNGMKTAVSFIGALVFRAFFVSLSFIKNL